jgi:ribulose-5-phosphate 4-epimerase/fuculose-1-phosphate aldolase
MFSLFNLKDVKVNRRTNKGEEIILLDLAGNKLEVDIEPASESPLHIAVYQKRPF